MQALQAGDLVFVRGTTWVDDAIEGVTRSKYSHVAMAVTSETLIEAQGGESVQLVPVNKYDGCADVYRSTLAPDVLSGIVANAQARLGEHYGYALIAEELVREETDIQLPFNEDTHPICSTLVVDAIRKEHVGLCQGIAYPAPGDIAQDGLYYYQYSY